MAAKQEDPGPASDGPRPARLCDISTRWSMIQGPPRLALEHVYTTYGGALLAWVRARLRRGDYHPLRADDAEDLLQDLFVRIGTSEWLSRPDRRLGRFRPYLMRKLVFFLRERRATALGHPAVASGPATDDAMGALPAPDDIDARLDREWRAATVRRCIERIRRRNPRHAEALDAALRADGRGDAEIAASLGWTLDAYRTCLRRGRAQLRAAVADEESRLDGPGTPELPGGGG